MSCTGWDVVGRFLLAIIIGWLNDQPWVLLRSFRIIMPTQPLMVLLMYSNISLTEVSPVTFREMIVFPRCDTDANIMSSCKIVVAIVAAPLSYIANVPETMGSYGCMMSQLLLTPKGLYSTKASIAS